MLKVVIGVDVGTGSARAGVFDLDGHSLGDVSRAIEMWRPKPDHVEQSSDNIWDSVCHCVREAMGKAAKTAGQDLDVIGIGFDATCSLVALDGDGKPVTVSTTGHDNQNVIVWMDHRALEQTARINAQGHDVLRYVGGALSPEMETPKLVWLKENLPETWKRTKQFFDLPDFLTWRATGARSRSLCSTVCKWTYLGHESRWDDAYFNAIGLGDLAEEGYERIGSQVLPIGAKVAGGLSERAAKDFGLNPGIPVGTSAIDAHAGGLGVIGAALPSDKGVPDLTKRLALICGTSSCHMAVSTEAAFVPGIWGPYFEAMVPGFWLNEGGQSATGALVDHVIRSHAAGPALLAEAERQGKTVYNLLNQRLDALAEDVPFPAALTQNIHVLPYFHGNRSPRADASLKGMISGLTLTGDADELAKLYLATIQAIAYGTRHIIEALNAKGYAIDTILACGGGTKNPVFIREHADAAGCRIVLPKETEAVLLGSAIVGAAAGSAYADIPSAMAAMSKAGAVIEAQTGAVRAYHDRKYKVFLRMYEDHIAYRDIMA